MKGVLKMQVLNKYQLNKHLRRAELALKQGLSVLSSKLSYGTLKVLKSLNLLQIEDKRYTNILQRKFCNLGVYRLTPRGKFNVSYVVEPIQQTDFQRYKLFGVFKWESMPQYTYSNKIRVRAELIEFHYVDDVSKEVSIVSTSHNRVTRCSMSIVKDKGSDIPMYTLQYGKVTTCNFSKCRYGLNFIIPEREDTNGTALSVIDRVIIKRLSSEMPTDVEIQEQLIS